MSGARPYLHAATLSLLRARSRKPSRPVRFLMIKRSYWQLLAITILAAAPAVAQTPDYPDRDKPDIDLYALMSGKCPTLKVAGRDFPCRAVAYFHSEKGRASFTVALDDPDDHTHIISFSGENGQRTKADFYQLNVDRMELNSQDRPKVDGLPVPALDPSDGTCRQIGNFARLQVISIVCSATDKNGRQYQLRFESDGTPITLRRVREFKASPKTMDPYQ
jgi:hypothetical protein